MIFGSDYLGAPTCTRLTRKGMILFISDQQLESAAVMVVTCNKPKQTGANLGRAAHGDPRSRGGAA